MKRDRATFVLTIQMSAHPQIPSRNSKNPKPGHYRKHLNPLGVLATNQPVPEKTGTERAILGIQIDLECPNPEGRNANQKVDDNIHGSISSHMTPYDSSDVFLGRLCGMSTDIGGRPAILRL